jgi:DNA-binding transcriptional regulator YhcF (GntR family)
MTKLLDVIALESLHLSVDREAELPIGVQLAWALRSGIQSGGFTPGQRLPGLREIAEATGVNVNTVKAVYQRLDREGLIESQQGSGTFVARAAGKPSEVTRIAASAAEQAHETGVDPRQVAAALYVTQESSDAPSGRADERSAIAVRRALRAQISALEMTLVEMEAAHPGVAPPTSSSRVGIGPALLSAEQLEHVRTLLVRRLAVVQSAIDEHMEEPRKPARKSREPAASTVKAPKRTRRSAVTAQPAPAGS